MPKRVGSRWNASRKCLPSDVKKIISGGQTGADRAALDAAMECGIIIGGYVPMGRWAEDGPIPQRYAGLIECGSSVPAVRTRLNVENSDATLIFSHGKLDGGSALTARLSRALKRDVLHIDLLKNSDSAAVEKIELWLRTMNISILNVAGPRASKDPAIYEDVKRVLRLLFLQRQRARP